MKTPLCEATDITKAFGATRALIDADLRILPGEVHALAGENGSGKSTLIKVLSGIVRPDSGSLTWCGKPLSARTPAHAAREGIVAVHQETLDAPEQRVVENIFMGTNQVLWPQSNHAEEMERAREVLQTLGVPNICPKRKMRSLSLPQRQLVTIARALVRDWQLLILDEATSALDVSLAGNLFKVLRSACDAGRSVVFTSHRMDEIMTFGDTVTVLRGGRTVMLAAHGQVTAQGVLQTMASTPISEHAVSAPRPASTRCGDPVLLAKELRVTEASRVSLSVHRGEVLGLIGLEGQGQVAVARRLAGLSARGTGTVEFIDRDKSYPIDSYADAKRHGIAFVPRDRKSQALFFSRSILENFAIAVLDQCTKFGVVRMRKVRKAFAESSRALQLRVPDVQSLIGTLSGGNQQKVVLARTLATKPLVIVLDDPMRGVDANTKHEFYPWLRMRASEQTAVVFVSTEIGELLAAADRIVVFHGGEIAQLLHAGDATEADVAAAMFGASRTTESG